MLFSNLVFLLFTNALVQARRSLSSTFGAKLDDTLLPSHKSFSEIPEKSSGTDFEENEQQSKFFNLTHKLRTTLEDSVAILPGDMKVISKKINIIEKAAIKKPENNTVKLKDLLKDSKDALEKLDTAITKFKEAVQEDDLLKKAQGILGLISSMTLEVPSQYAEVSKQIVGLANFVLAKFQNKENPDQTTQVKKMVKDVVKKNLNRFKKIQEKVNIHACKSALDRMFGDLEPLFDDEGFPIPHSFADLSHLLEGFHHNLQTANENLDELVGYIQTAPVPANDTIDFDRADSDLKTYSDEINHGYPGEETDGVFYLGSFENRLRSLCGFKECGVKFTGYRKTPNRNFEEYSYYKGCYHGPKKYRRCHPKKGLPIFRIAKTGECDWDDVGSFLASYLELETLKLLALEYASQVYRASDGVGADTKVRQYNNKVDITISALHNLEHELKEKAKKEKEIIIEFGKEKGAAGKKKEKGAWMTSTKYYGIKKQYFQHANLYKHAAYRSWEIAREFVKLLPSADMKWSRLRMRAN